MKKTYQYLFGASLALVTFSFIGNASAQSCATPPTCASLGYIYSQTECEGHSFVKCPFDTNFGYCDLSSAGKKSCADGGYSAVQINDCNCKSVKYEGLTCYSCTLKTCQELGYKDSLKGPGWKCTPCPYDATKFLCIAIPCPPETTKSYSCDRVNGLEWGKLRDTSMRDLPIYKFNAFVSFSGDQYCCAR